MGKRYCKWRINTGVVHTNMLRIHDKDVFKRIKWMQKSKNVKAITEMNPL